MSLPTHPSAAGLPVPSLRGAAITLTTNSASSKRHARLLPHTQTRSARWIKQPRRPYQFTQIIQLSDGSTYTQRTTSPAAMFRSTKDKMNNLLWQPSNKALQSVELDEAGKLAAFRERFGRGWDISVKARKDGEEPPGPGRTGAGAAAREQPEKDAPGPALATGKDTQHRHKTAPGDYASSMSDLLRGYAIKSGQDFSAVKGRSVKRKKT